jgi:hypothetical protein
LTKLLASITIDHTEIQETTSWELIITLLKISVNAATDMMKNTISVNLLAVGHFLFMVIDLNGL